jgi:hypothetical protein
VVWTSTLIKKVKRVDNVVSRAVDQWFDSTIGGYITVFYIDKVESYSQAERYFFKGPRGKFLHFLKLQIKLRKTTMTQRLETCIVGDHLENFLW